MFHPLRSRLFIKQFFSIFLIVIFTFVSISTVLLSLTRDSLEDQQLELLTSYRTQVASTMERWLAGRRDEVRSRASVLGLIDPTRYGSPRLTEFIARELAHSRYFINFAIIGADGYELNSKDGGTDGARMFVGDQWYFDEAMSGTAVVTGFMNGIKSDRPVMVIAEPIPAPDGVRHLFLGLIPLETVTGIVGSLELGRYGNAYFVDGSGRLLAATARRLPGMNIDTFGIREVTERREGTAIYRGPIGKRVFGSYTWLYDLQAGLVVEFLDEIVMRPLYLLFRIMGLLAAVFTAIGILAAYLLSRSVLKPVKALILTASGITVQNYQKPIEFRTDTELDILIDRMNAMQEAICTRESLLKRKNEELRREKIAAEEASRLKSQFLSSMSHELRTPLNSIIGFTTRVLKKTKAILPGTQRDNLSIVRAEAQHLLTIINDILDFSKIEAGKMDVFTEPFDAGTLLSEAIAATSGLIGEKPVHMRQTNPGGECALSSDRTKVKQILLNLLSNAVKYSDRGTVSVSVERTRGGCRFRISDEGIGIPATELETIFEEFHQVDGSSTRKAGGTGLGLAITKRLVELLRGKIMVESTPGRGSSFTVILPDLPPSGDRRESRPLLPAPAASRAPSPEPPPEPSPGAKDRRSAHAGRPEAVLVVDDDEHTLELFSQYLREYGCRVLTCSNGAEVLPSVRRECPDAIILDIMLPGTTGWDVLAELKRDENTRSIPVIIVSILREHQTAYDNGADGYLVKPVEQEELFETVCTSIMRRGPAGEILLVGEDAGFRESMGLFLRSTGLPVRFASDGEEGLAALRERRPAVLIIVSLSGPGADVRMLEEIRKDERWKRLPVIMVTEGTLARKERSLLRKNGVTIMKRSGTIERRIARILGLKPAEGVRK